MSTTNETKHALAVIDAIRYETTGRCPHCGSSHKHSTAKRLLRNLDNRNFYGELLKCNICVQPFLAVYYPMLKSSKTSFWAWERKESHVAN